MPTFRYCLNSCTIKPTPLLDKIRIAGSAGYAAIELWHDDIDAHILSGGQLGDIPKALADAQIEVASTQLLTGWWDTAGDVHVTAMDEVKRRLQQASNIGAKYAVCSPPLGFVDFGIGAQAYAELLDVARGYNVQPALQYLGFADQVNTIEKAVEIVNRSEHDNTAIVLDPFHCFRGGGTIDSIRLVKPEQIAFSEFNDAPAFPPRQLQQDADRVLPGEGIIDLKRYCHLLAGTGFDGFLSLALFNRQLWARNPKDVARTGLDTMKSIAEA